MHYVNRFLPGIGIVLWGTTILLSCNHPHATQMNDLTTHGIGTGMQRRNNNGWGDLHVAVRRGNEPLVHTLLNQIPAADKVTLIHQRDNNGHTALHMAAWRGHAAVVKTLLSQIPEANIHQADNVGRTALCMAVLGGHAAVVKTLLSQIQETDRVTLISQKIRHNGPAFIHHAERN